MPILRDLAPKVLGPDQLTYWERQPGGLAELARTLATYLAEEAAGCQQLARFHGKPVSAEVVSFAMEQRSAEGAAAGVVIYGATPLSQQRCADLQALAEHVRLHVGADAARHVTERQRARRAAAVKVPAAKLWQWFMDVAYRLGTDEYRARRDRDAGGLDAPNDAPGSRG